MLATGAVYQSQAIPKKRKKNAAASPSSQSVGSMPTLTPRTVKNYRPIENKNTEMLKRDV